MCKHGEGCTCLYLCVPVRHGLCLAGKQMVSGMAVHGRLAHNSSWGETQGQRIEPILNQAMHLPTRLVRQGIKVAGP